MRKTLLWTVGTLALLFVSACSEPPVMAPRRCVDNQNRVIDENVCEADQRLPGYGSPGFVYYHHWYYGGEPGYIPYGVYINGGTYVRPFGYYNFYYPRYGVTYRRTFVNYGGGGAVIRTGRSTTIVRGAVGGGGFGRGVYSGGSTVSRGVFGGSARSYGGGFGAGE